VRAWPTSSGSRVTDLSPLDALCYQRAVRAVTSAIESALGPDVVANRVADSASLRLEPLAVARRRFAARLSRMMGRERGHVLHADVRNCYANIGGDPFAAALRALGCHPDQVAEVAGVLESLQRGGVRGLPVGPDPSAVLANAVLAEVDLSLRRNGFEAIRWVDDFFVRIERPGQADRALTALGAALGNVGLTLAAEKNRVVAFDPRRPVGGAWYLGSGSGQRSPVVIRARSGLPPCL
jgi:Reverse transcriptase (RNA-dependent DNA polymerase)